MLQAMVRRNEPKPMLGPSACCYCRIWEHRAHPLCKDGRDALHAQCVRSLCDGCRVVADDVCVLQRALFEVLLQPLGHELVHVWLCHEPINLHVAVQPALNDVQTAQICTAVIFNSLRPDPVSMQMYRSRGSSSSFWKVLGSQLATDHQSYISKVYAMLLCSPDRRCAHQQRILVRCQLLSDACCVLKPDKPTKILPDSGSRTTAYPYT